MKFVCSCEFHAFWFFNLTLWFPVFSFIPSVCLTCSLMRPLPVTLEASPLTGGAVGSEASEHLCHWLLLCRPTMGTTRPWKCSCSPWWTWTSGTRRAAPHWTWLPSRATRNVWKRWSTRARPSLWKTMSPRGPHFTPQVGLTQRTVPVFAADSKLSKSLAAPSSIPIFKAFLSASGMPTLFPNPWLPTHVEEIRVLWPDGLWHLL